MLERVLAAHTKAAGAGTRVWHVFGGDKLIADFAQTVIVAVMLNCLCDAEHWPVDKPGDMETPLSLAERKLRAFVELKNGGFPSAKAKEFQNALWYGMFNFITGPRRCAHPIKTLQKHQWTDIRNLPYIDPYADDGRTDLSPPEDTDASSPEDTDVSPPDEENTNTDIFSREELLVRETPQNRGDVIIEASELESFLDNRQHGLERRGRRLARLYD